MNYEFADNALQNTLPMLDGLDSIVISGRGSDAFNADAFNSWLRTLGPKFNGVEHVRIQPSAHLTDCEFLQFFPHVKSVAAHGSELRSLNGIRSAKSLETLILSIAAKNRFDLSELRETNVRYLRIEKAGLKDLMPLPSCKSIRRLEVVGGELTDAAVLSGMDLMDLAFIQCKIRHYSDSQDADGPQALSFVNCREFEGFSGDCDAVKSVIVESCGKFRVETLDRLRNVRAIRFMGIRSGFELSSIGGLSGATELAISDCKVEIGDGTFRQPSGLKKIWLSPLKDDVLQLLSAKNPNIWFCNGRDLYLAGNRQLDMQAYYSL